MKKKSFVELEAERFNNNCSLGMLFDTLDDQLEKDETSEKEICDVCGRHLTEEEYDKMHIPNFGDYWVQCRDRAACNQQECRCHITSCPPSHKCPLK